MSLCQPNFQAHGQPQGGWGGVAATTQARQPQNPPPPSTYRRLGLPRPRPGLLKLPRFFYRVLLVILFWKRGADQGGRHPVPGPDAQGSALPCAEQVTAPAAFIGGTDGRAGKGAALPRGRGGPAPSLLGTWRPGPGVREGPPEPAAQRVHLGLPGQEHQDAACGKEEASVSRSHAQRIPT